MAITEILSKYSKRFDDSCISWARDPELNIYFLKYIQDYANDLLQRSGYLFLNRVFELLGIAPTKAGQIVGWIYAPGKMIDFGISKEDGTSNYMLNFNVDGEILDKTDMEDYQEC